MPMRSGKTKTAIDWVCIMHLKYRYTRVLVVCPLSVVGVWEKQIKIHQPEEFPIKWKVINFERVYDRKQYEDGWEPMPRKALYKWKPQIIIVDESHKIGNPSAVQSRHLYRLQKKLSKKQSVLKLIMTGTPFHRKLLMAFGQFKFLDEGIFGTNFGAFKREFARFGGYGGYKLLGYKNKGKFLKRIGHVTFLMKTLPQVPPQHEVVPYRLKESEPYYESMARDSIALFQNGSVVEAPIALTRALRLAQLCGGRLRDSEGQMLRVGKEKAREFDGLVESFVENEVNKFVVIHRFVPEMVDSVKIARKHGYKVYLMYGKTHRNLREQRIAEFDETEERAVFICQASTGALGIDLSAASVAVFYSLPESLVTYDQVVARIKKWREKRTLTYYYLIGDGTIEEVALSALRANLSLIDALERDPKLLSYSTTE